jgi:hypothetical protein
MRIRAKFTVSSVTRYQGGVRLEMAPVMGTYVDGKYVPETENSRFWDASPSGRFEICVQEKMPAYAEIVALKPGDAYYLDLTPAAP